MEINVRPVLDMDRPWITAKATKDWAGEFIIVAGRKIFPAEIPGFFAEDTAQNKIGLISYLIADQVCEIITFNAFTRKNGIGTVLLKAVIDLAKDHQCQKIKLVTTNDNLDALRFYQRRGFSITEIHPNSVDKIRPLKPGIPALGYYQIPIRDEIVLEMIF